MSVQTIEHSIVPRGRERVLRYIDRQDGCRAGCRTVETERPGMCEAIEHVLSLVRAVLRGIILLVEEKAGWAMDIVNIVQDTVFADRHMAVQVRL